MRDLQFALLGAGFWSTFQLAGWYEVGGARCVGVYNRTRSRAEALARRFDIPAVYDDPREMLEKERPDFADVVTDAGTHGKFTRMAAELGIPVVCQKPLAPSLEEALQMEAACRKAGVPLLVNENFRWQTPIRTFHGMLKSGVIGRVFRGHVIFASSFPVFDNQPFLKELDRFILTDVGTHILDVARFLFGEAESLYARTSRVNPGIRGEDVATVVLGMKDGATVICELSYASRWEHERFPETYLLAEGERGSLELGPDYWIRATTADGTRARRHPPPRYGWADPAYDVVHASIVDCQRNLLEFLREGKPAETTAEDNLKTLRLAYGAYDSARECKTIRP